MTQDSRLKKLVRARMAETGENYTRALHAITNPVEYCEICKVEHPRLDARTIPTPKEN